MKNWPTMTMAQVTRLVTDGKHGDCEDEKDSGYFFLSSKDLRDGRLHYDKPRQITHGGFLETHRRTKLEPGDILLANCGASIGRVGLAQTDPRIYKTTFQKSISVIKAETSIVDNRFLYYFVRHKSALLIRLGNGAAQPNLLIGDLKRIEVSVPPKPLQQRIAGILSAYDELIENSQRRIEILEAMARGLYREWFVHFRFPGHENHPRVASAVGEIPEGWEVKSVHQIAGLVSRGPSLSYVDTGGIQVVNQRCIRDDEIEMQAVQYATPLSEKKSHLYIQPFDVLINSMGVGTLGRVSRNLSIDEPTIIHNCITVVRARSGEPTRVFLFYRLSDCQAHFEGLGIGATGQTSLRIETIEDVQFALPPVALLSVFEKVIVPMWTQIGVLKRQTKNLRRTRDLLLPRLLSGQINVEAP